MKKIYNYIMLFTLAFVAVCCSEEVIDAPTTSAKTGDEVQFGLSLEGASRTVYGNPAEGATTYPIYWVNEDKVQIFSPQCLDGKRSAEYQVSVENEAQNFATELSKTGENGLQWVADTHDFYSIYPSGNYTFNLDDTQNVLASGIGVNAQQTVYYEGSNGFVHDMSNCLMYAYTPQVDKGVVSLSYNPLSTVFWVEMKAADAPENAMEGQIKNFKILGITLTSSETYIAGNFTLKLSDGSLNTWIDGTKSIDITLRDKTVGEQDNYTLNAGQTVKFPVFMAPVSSWGNSELKIAINTDQGTFTKTIVNTSNSSSLEPGKIHEIKLPELDVEDAGEWDVSTWMRYIPRNVYLSEISIPGTWNSLNVDCQSITTISEQYKLGVRAFHLDTRWKADNSPWLGETFTGITKPTITKLSVALGGSGNTYKYDGANLMQPDYSSFSDYLKQITDYVKDDEYMVVFCTFAQNSYNGELCPSTWYEAISDACANNEKVYNASGLNKNTLVGDVLGSVIVVVNLDTKVENATLPEDSKCLFTYVPMNLPSDHYTDPTAAGHVDALYYSTKASAGISMYTSHAQISTTGTSAVDCGDRGYSHPLANRDALVNSIWDWSKSIYGTPNYAHDKWIYLGLGGYIMTSSGSSGSGYDTVENRYAPMVYDRIEAMGQNNVPYYPVGIILMNNKIGSNYTNSSGTNLGYGFSDVCKEILLLNNKYRLQYDPNKPADYNPSALSVTNYSATATNGGNAF